MVDFDYRLQGINVPELSHSRRPKHRSNSRDSRFVASYLWLSGDRTRINARAWTLVDVSKRRAKWMQPTAWANRMRSIVGRRSVRSRPRHGPSTKSRNSAEALINPLRSRNKSIIIFHGSLGVSVISKTRRRCGRRPYIHGRCFSRLQISRFPDDPPRGCALPTRTRSSFFPVLCFLVRVSRCFPLCRLLRFVPYTHVKFRSESTINHSIMAILPTVLLCISNGHWRKRFFVKFS